MSESLYDFLATATDENGHRATRHVVAYSATDAVELLEADGFTDIVLHTDDAGAASTRMTALEDGGVTPEDMAKLPLSTFRYFLFLLKKQYLSQWVVTLVLAALIAFTLVSGEPNGRLFWIAVVLMVIPFPIAFYFTFFTHSRKYERLVEAAAWGRWETVLQLVPKLRGHVADLELDAREAVALAKTGQVEEGLAVIRQNADKPEAPRWLYLSRLAEFYLMIEQHEQALDLQRQAWEEAPDNPTVEIDYAMSLLRHERNLDEAERLIESAERKPLSDLLQKFLPFVCGLRELNRKRNLEAISCFTEARKELAPLAQAQPMLHLMMDLCAAYLAIACARNGDMETARRYARPARRRLEALDSRRLLSRLNEAVGGGQ